MSLLILAFTSLVFASEMGSIEIYSAPSEDVKPVEQAIKTESQPTTKKTPNQKRKTASYAEKNADSGNLPTYFVPPKGVEIRSKVVLSTDTKQEKLLSVRAGDTAQIEIHHSIIAFSDEKAPVVGIVRSGPLTGAKLFGSSNLEKNSKRIFIEFERVSFGGSTYELKASAITEFGTQGFTGEYYSQESKYFAGDFLSSFVAAYFDAQVPRTTNAYGQIQDDRSVDSAFKKGVAAGALSSAERFREKLKKAPEFSELVGPIRASVLIYEGGQRL